MSVETSRTNPPGDGDSDDEQTYGYRSADSAAAVDDDLDDDDELDDDTVASVDDDDEDGDTASVQGTVFDSSAPHGHGTTEFLRHHRLDAVVEPTSMTLSADVHPGGRRHEVDDSAVTDGDGRRRAGQLRADAPARPTTCLSWSIRRPPR